MVFSVPWIDVVAYYATTVKNKVTYYANDPRDRPIYVLAMPRPKRQKRHFIAAWMQATGKTNADLIAATGADKSNVSRWTAGTEPSTDYMDSLAVLFGTTVAGLYAPPPRQRGFLSRVWLRNLQLLA